MKTTILLTGLCLLLFVGIICFLGFCFDYSLYSCFGKDIPFLLDCLAGAFSSAIIVPTAIVCLVLNFCGVPTPYIDL